MTPTDAAWVRDNAWRTHHRKTHTELPTFYTDCPCNSGTCGACDGHTDGQPRHDRCLSRQHGHPVVFPATHITDQRGFVVAAVWPTGTPCRYICHCPCAKTGFAAPPPRRNNPDRKSGQLDLLAVTP